MKSFLHALQFLTILPLKIKFDEQKLITSMPFFPAIGVVIGLILAGADYGLSMILPNTVTNLLLIVILVILTGGMHLDGLADTFDAIASGKDRKQMLKIMRESSVGAIGVVSLCSIILLKFFFLISLESIKTISLLFMCILSRWGMLLPMFLFAYAREQGKAKIFISGMNLKLFILGSVVCGVLVFAIWQIKGFYLWGSSLLFVLIISSLFASKIGGITGDVLGAVNELTEVFCLAGIYILCKYL